MLRIFITYLMVELSITAIYNAMNRNWRTPTLKRFIHHGSIGTLDLGDIPADEYSERMEMLTELEANYQVSYDMSEILSEWRQTVTSDIMSGNSHDAEKSIQDLIKQIEQRKKY